MHRSESEFNWKCQSREMLSLNHFLVLSCIFNRASIMRKKEPLYAAGLSLAVASGTPALGEARTPREPRGAFREKPDCIWRRKTGLAPH